MAERVSSGSSPMSASGSARHFRKEFPDFCAGSISKKVLLKTSPIAEKEIRGPLINDVSRKKVERGVDVAEALGVDQAVLALGAGAFGLVEKSSEVLACCLAISRLVSAADDHAHAGPTSFAKILAPSSEQRVQLLELDAHGQLRSFESGRGEGTHMFCDSIEVHGAFGENSVDERTRAAQQLGGRVHGW